MTSDFLQGQSVSKLMVGVEKQEVVEWEMGCGVFGMDQRRCLKS